MNDERPPLEIIHEDVDEIVWCGNTITDGQQTSQERQMSCGQRYVLFRHLYEHRWQAKVQMRPSK